MDSADGYEPSFVRVRLPVGALCFLNATVSIPDPQSGNVGSNPTGSTMNTKICPQCKQEKHVSDFGKNVTRSDGLSRLCTLCKREKDREYYKNNSERPSKLKERKHRIYKENREFIRGYLQAHPCEHCGFTDIRALDFHHKDPTQKEYNISMMLYFSQERIKLEIEKCSVLCSNCHRIEHY